MGKREGKREKREMGRTRERREVNDFTEKQKKTKRCNGFYQVEEEACCLGEWLIMGWCDIAAEWIKQLRRRR